MSTPITYLVNAMFTRPFGLERMDIARQLINEGDQNVLWQFAVSFFSQPFSQNHKDLLRKLIERGDSHVLSGLKSEAFKQDFMKTPEYKFYREAANMIAPEERILHFRKYLDGEKISLDAEVNAKLAACRQVSAAVLKFATDIVEAVNGR